MKAVASKWCQLGSLHGYYFHSCHGLQKGELKTAVLADADVEEF